MAAAGKLVMILTFQGTVKALGVPNDTAISDNSQSKT
jgi:hypothetical protein